MERAYRFSLCCSQPENPVPFAPGICSKSHRNVWLNDKRPCLEFFFNCLKKEVICERYFRTSEYFFLLKYIAFSLQFGNPTVNRFSEISSIFFHAP